MSSEITSSGYETTSPSSVIISSSSIENGHGTVTTTTAAGLSSGDNEKTEDRTAAANQEDDDELSKLNSASLSGSALTRQKSATLTPMSGTGNNSDSSGSSQRSSSPGGHNAFMHSARNNLRRSFTLPRGLLLRKSGQTGPVAENQNGNFVRSIFLTLTRSKSVRKKRQDETDDSTTNGPSESEGQLSNISRCKNIYISIYFKMFLYGQVNKF